MKTVEGPWPSSVEGRAWSCGPNSSSWGLRSGHQDKSALLCSRRRSHFDLRRRAGTIQAIFTCRPVKRRTVGDNPCFAHAYKESVRDIRNFTANPRSCTLKDVIVSPTLSLRRTCSLRRAADQSEPQTRRSAARPPCGPPHRSLAYISAR